MNTQPRPPLNNIRHEKFAQAIVRGVPVFEAYKGAGYKLDRGNASRLLSSDVIKRRVREIREENNELSQLSRERAIAHLTDIALTPVGEVSPSSPLCQEYAETATEHGPCLRVKMPDKIRALQLIGKWCGWETGNQAEQDAAKALGGIAEMMQRIRNGGMVGAGGVHRSVVPHG